ncbi:MAG: DNA alkylation repair protein [Acidimicrobiia bacterium]|nr:DNA alkylation repair protein [Acidimicrobiia bacterium]
MAQPLKDSFGVDIPGLVAAPFAAVDPAFESEGFEQFCLDGYVDLELTPRARRIADGLAAYLPDDRGRALDLLVESLAHGQDPSTFEGMDGFRYLPHVYFVADHGLDHFERAMTAQYELTQLFTAEFSIRSYLVHHRDATLRRLREWTTDPNVHVRRLVSEGTRPRLPWAPRLREFQDDPTPVLDLLEDLRDDQEEYVRRSVANNLNDIAKDHSDVVVDTARRWWADGDEHRRRLVRHGLRTLVKRGDPGALEVLGYGADSPVTIDEVEISPATVQIGGRVTIEMSLTNPSTDDAGALVDLRVHFVKANGSTSPKVFKGKELQLAPGESGAVRKTISVAQHSTRTHHPGTHVVDAIVNGATRPIGAFEVGD